MCGSVGFVPKLIYCVFTTLKLFIEPIKKEDMEPTSVFRWIETNKYTFLYNISALAGMYVVCYIIFAWFFW